jgi:TonB family protein
VVLAAALLACTAPTPPQPSRRTAPLEDAAPRFYGEGEVEVPARPLEPIRPEYPALERSRGLEGDATLLVHVRSDGKVMGARLVNGEVDAFARSALAAVRVTPFAAGVRRGEPVDSTVTVRVRFRLED